MYSQALRPLLRSAANPSSALRLSVAARSCTKPSLLAARFSTKPSLIAAQAKLQQARPQQQQVAAPKHNKVLMAAMPQLIPFYFVNEVVAGYACVVILCYALTKYFLPQTVRTRLARLFVSKL